jgi:hypothetical protein
MGFLRPWAECRYKNGERKEYWAKNWGNEWTISKDMLLGAVQRK